jgi:F0F1-type ATP synthase membrane subunit b/b'
MNPAQMNLNPLSQIDPIVIVSIMVLMLATYFALRKVFVVPYITVMDKRQQLFDAADEEQLAAQDVVRQADYECERALSDAAQAAEQIRSETRDRAERYRRERVDEATASSSERLERGRAGIEEERATEVAALRSQAIDCVGLACGQLLGKADNEVVEAAVDRLMSRRTR